jgi:hypothetical protein
LESEIEKKKQLKKNPKKISWNSGQLAKPAM